MEEAMHVLQKQIPWEMNKKNATCLFHGFPVVVMPIAEWNFRRYKTTKDRFKFRSDEMLLQKCYGGLFAPKILKILKHKHEHLKMKPKDHPFEPHELRWQCDLVEDISEPKKTRNWGERHICSKDSNISKQNMTDTRIQLAAQNFGIEHREKIGRDGSVPEGK